MFTILSILYVVVCVFLILIVLLQSGKSGGIGALSGGSTQSVFGGAGASNFLTRLTSICAALFMVLSATLAYLSSQGEQSLDRAADALEAEMAGQGTDSSEETAPPEATPDETAVDEVAPDETTPHEATPDETAVNEAAPAAQD